MIPFDLRPIYLKQVHDRMHHNGISRMHEHLKNYWWESKLYVKSCELCARRKGRYGKRTEWPLGHCKRGQYPFQRVFTDFVHMKSSKGNKYLLTILYSYSRYFIAIPTVKTYNYSSSGLWRSRYKFHRISLQRILLADRYTAKTEVALASTEL